MTSMLQTQELWKFVGEEKGQEQSADTDLGFLRSGFAPPTRERSLSSTNGIFEGSAFLGHKKRGGDDVWADPAYVDCYYSNWNVNPRLSPALLSKEEWRFAQPPRFDGGWGGDGLGSDRRITDMYQDDMNQATGAPRHLCPPACRSSFDVNVGSPEPKFAHPSHGTVSADSSSHSHVSAFLSRNASPDLEGLTEADELASIFYELNLSRNDMPSLKENRSWSHPRGEMYDLRNPFDLQDTKSYWRGPSGHFSYHDASAFSSTHAPNGFASNPPSPSLLPLQRGNGNSPTLQNNAYGSVALGSDLLGVESPGRTRNHAARNSLYAPLAVDPSLRYARSNGLGTTHVAALGEAEIPENDYLGGPYLDFLETAYVEALINQRKTHHSGKSGCDYHGSPAFGPAAAAYQRMCFSPGPRKLSNGFIGPWNVDSERSLDESFASSLLGEFKSHRTKSLELSEIAGHIVEFSSDQYGSRFIQQKLETATVDEKNKVYDEIMPKALSLMTDVFGNYVIQKFMEHGTPTQIRELADKLTGNVLALSLQMYGCRVIQKAIEVVELDQKTEMVKELDGHVMRCVRDQNGNHVIQKCIECVPEDAIQFIISTLYDQVVTLSTHSYGCRVIQRILENCQEEKTLQIIMDEILSSVYKLAQDQYGNYVVQHVLEHGKPHERSAIIGELTGQIVQMSQQKFASNVIEKCLTFGTSTERKSLVSEMLGFTDENQPLQVMMKDQFGNYVVQKVLETCDDQQLELILNRIKVHLNALKKYTYGKHIVARVEKLVAAGERRISILGLNSS